MTEKEYIERKSLCEDLKQMAKYQEPYKQSTILGVVQTIESRKAADVAPRAEIAEEIFEEIEKMILKYYNDDWYTVPDMGCDIEILKQKYTGATVTNDGHRNEEEGK